MENKHNQLRKRLDLMGYDYPLPAGAINLVSSILDDLLQTTESLKRAKYEIKQLLSVRNQASVAITKKFVSDRTVNNLFIFYLNL
jgi:hypothetical protein